MNGWFAFGALVVSVMCMAIIYSFQCRSTKPSLPDALAACDAKTGYEQCGCLVAAYDADRDNVPVYLAAKKCFEDEQARVSRAADGEAR